MSDEIDLSELEDIDIVETASAEELGINTEDAWSDHDTGKEEMDERDRGAEMVTLRVSGTNEAL